MMGIAGNEPPEPLTPLLPEHLYTIQDVATLLRLKYDATRKFIQKKIPRQYHIKAGARKLIPLQALTRALYKAWTCPHCGGDLRDEAVK